MPHPKTIILFEEYSDRVVYGEEDGDEALQNAIDFTFSNEDDDFRANLFTRLKEKWDAVQVRMIFATTDNIITEIERAQVSGS